MKNYTGDKYKYARYAPTWYNPLLAITIHNNVTPSKENQHTNNDSERKIDNSSRESQAGPIRYFTSNITDFFEKPLSNLRIGGGTAPILSNFITPASLTLPKQEDRSINDLFVNINRLLNIFVRTSSFTCPHSHRKVTVEFCLKCCPLNKICKWYKITLPIISGWLKPE